MAGTEWLTVPQCARQAGVDPKTIHRYLRSGRLDVRVLRVERTTRVHRGDWDQWLAKRVVMAGVPMTGT